MMIFTGMDNSGKTTVVQKTAKKLGLPVVKSLGPHHSVNKKHIWLLDQMTREKAFPGSVIFDRFLPFEEMVYGKVLRGDPIYSLDDPYMKSLKDLNPIIVYTRPHSSTIFNWDGREQMKGVIEQKEKLLAAWDDLMWGLMARGWDVQVYDYEADKEDRWVSDMDEFAKFLSHLVETTHPSQSEEGQPLKWKKHEPLESTEEEEN